MAKINTFSISSVETDTVSYTYSYTPESYTKRDESGYSRTTEAKTETVSWSFSTTGGSSTTSPCSYTRGGTGTTTYNLKATLTTNYTIKKYGWNLTDYYYDMEYTSQRQDTETRSQRVDYVYQGSTMVNNQIIYYYDIYYYSWSEISSSTGTSTDTKTITFYPRPVNFTFTNCVAGKQWLISEGINKNLITNLTSFQAIAQQWKSWKNQKAESICPAFDSPISAAKLNSIHTYVGSGKSYNKGDKISAEMFNSLASAINSTT